MNIWKYVDIVDQTFSHPTVAPERGKHLDRGGLASPVGAEQAEDLSVPKGRLHSVSFCSDESRNLAHPVCMGDFDALRVRLEELC